MASRRMFAFGLMLLAAGAAPAFAQDVVKIGGVFPLTGAAASEGTALRDAVEVAVDIINNPHPELSALPLGAGAGLPGLGGRKVAVVFGDHQGSPATAQSQTLRLITQEKVVAVTGAYQSSSTLTASAIAERYGVPFVSGESTAPSLTERNFKWFFRTTPIGGDFGEAYAQFLDQRKAKGMAIGSVALINENTEYGTSVGDAIVKALTGHGYKVDLRIPYAAASTDVSAQVLQLKQANPSVAIFVSYTSDAILFTKTMHTLDWKPAVLIGDDSGFSDTAYIAAVNDLAQGIIDRASWDIGKPGSLSYAVNELFKKRTGRDMSDTAARGMQGFFVLCDAINRAGSTEPAKIQAALKATDLKPNQLFVAYNGVRFNEQGQNALGSTLLVQLVGKDYVPIWPDANATAAATLPFVGWAK
ncbi:MAG: ABC transporter substrate-binding protein [Pseudomonadota bacterium]|nr:ABC transporter substrate-binding protein [Pseudomonadota bacterium]